MHGISTKATINDIARKLNITASTVSRALNEHPAISEATKKAVKKTAKKLDYHHNRIASSLRLGKTKIIGVLIPSAEINFFGSVVHGIERIASELDYNVLMYQSNELFEFEKRGVETFLRSRVDGVLASISKETTNLDHYLKFKKRGIPLILFDRANDTLGVPSVVVDDYKGAFNATQHLILQGCKRIAHIAGQQHVAIFNQRLKGYIDALSQNNLPIDEDLIIYGKVTIESGRACMSQLLSGKPITDGVFAVEDFTALGAMQALKASGTKVPEEVALIGFANETFGAYLSPSLSTVDQQTIKMGEEAAKLFFELSANNNFYKSGPVKRVLEPVLIYRDSSLRKNRI
jgi:LacI family transcriptional regulator